MNTSDFAHKVSRKLSTPPVKPSAASKDLFFNATQLYNHPVVVLTPQMFDAVSGLRSAKVVLMFDRNLTLFRHPSGEGAVNVVLVHYNHRYKKFWPGKFNSKTR